MERTVKMGMNRTGTMMSPLDTEEMQRYADAMGTDSPSSVTNPTDKAGSPMLADELRAALTMEAGPIGSVPLPASVKGMVATTLDKATGNAPEVLIDKLAERLAFERTGTRLYESLLARAPQFDASAIDPDMLATMQQFHDEEAQHFAVVEAAMREIGADPTAMTPCADTSAVASSGVLKVIADPRTSLPQCLNAVLTAEMTDNAGWELLIKLAQASGHDEMARSFGDAHRAEERHMATVKRWLEAAVLAEGA